jgi:uncharacterized metal-binding protein YceD (DUF177 family)
MTDGTWSAQRSWTQLRRGGEETLPADDSSRARIAKLLDLQALNSLVATLTYEPWLDGAVIRGRVEATTTRLCGVSLDPLEENVDAPFEFRFVPEGSPNAPAAEAELVVVLDADDPPEVVQGDAVDLAHYVIEILSLALEPFPRKPGAVFIQADATEAMSPFAVLRFPKPGRET